MEKRFAYAVVVLVVVCCGSTSAQNSGLTLNIDCGATTNSVDAVGVEWVPDAAFIPTGTNHQGFSPPSDSTFASLPELTSLRAFADTRAKNCYRLPVAKNSTYLLRAAFFYGNYDNTATPPSFKLSIEATVVENITTSSTGVLYKEILYLSQSNVTYLCLLRDGSNGTPFVSSISLRQVTEVYDQFNMYLGDFKYMTIRTRINFGGSALVRYPDDPYDRYWHPEGAMSPYLSPTTTPVQALGTNVSIPSKAFRPPSPVMQSAVTTSGNLTSLYLTPNSSAYYPTAFILLHFAELDPAATNTSRVFYMDVDTGTTPVAMNPFNESGGTFQRVTWLFWDRTIGGDTELTLFPASLPVLNGPILNCMEIYSVSDPRKATTTDDDVAAIEVIKTDMNLSEWTGDPCVPSPYPWVQCSAPIPVLTAPVVTAINLTGYSLTGPISPSFANLLNLTSLSLGNNSLIGLLPNLSPLVQLTTLNLENNNLNGPLPNWLASLPHLQVLTVQNNNFNGTIPVGLLTSSNLQFTSCPGNNFVGNDCNEVATTSKSESSNLPAIIGATVGGVVLTLLIIIVGVYIGCRRRRRDANAQQNSGGASDLAVPLKEIGNNSSSSKAFTLAALAAATNNFQKEIGRGGFGPVYHGILPDGREVAVKVADNPTRPGDQEFHNEVSLLSKLHHRNLTKLVGYCQEKKKQILVYEYVRDGSLHDQLHGNLKSARPLDWRTRLNIALNAARGLDYLHSNCQPSIIHRDVKSGNILLTGPGHAEVAKVADFGFSRAGPVQDNTHVSTEVRGTAGYLDPQYFDTQKLTLKSDVFSFGVVLLELITGRLPIDSSVANREEWNLCQYVRKVLGGGGDANIEQILDPVVRACRPNLDAVWVVAEVALRSVEPKAVHRPTMAEVLQELHTAIALEHHASQATPTPARQQHPHPHPDRNTPFHEHPISQPNSMIFYQPDSMPEPR